MECFNTEVGFAGLELKWNMMEVYVNYLPFSQHFFQAVCYQHLIFELLLVSLLSML